MGRTRSRPRAGGRAWHRGGAPLPPSRAAGLCGAGHGEGAPLTVPVVTAAAGRETEGRACVPISQPPGPQERGGPHSAPRARRASASRTDPGRAPASKCMTVGPSWACLLPAAKQKGRQWVAQGALPHTPLPGCVQGAGWREGGSGQGGVGGEWPDAEPRAMTPKTAAGSQ